MSDLAIILRLSSACSIEFCKWVAAAILILVLLTLGRIHAKTTCYDLYKNCCRKSYAQVKYRNEINILMYEWINIRNVLQACKSVLALTWLISLQTTQPVPVRSYSKVSNIVMHIIILQNFCAPINILFRVSEDSRKKIHYWNRIIDMLLSVPTPIVLCAYLIEFLLFKNNQEIMLFE